MQKVDLKKVFEMLINEEQDNAEGLLHQWFVEKTKAIHESLMQEDDILEIDDLTKGIEDDKDEIKGEEFYGEAEDDSEDDPEVDALASDNVEKSLDNDEDDANDEHTPGGDVDHFDGNPEDMTTDIDGIKDQFDDLQSDLARLKAEFEKIAGGEETTPPDGDTEQHADASSDVETVESMGNEDEEEEPFTESDLDGLEDLGESFELEKVTAPDMTSPRYSGTGGKISPNNDTSLIPGKVKPDIYSAKPVKFGGDEKPHYVTDNVPEVKKAPLRKNQVKNAADDLEEVPPMGPKGALLNTKSDGFGSDKVNNFVGGVNRKVRESRKR